MAEVAGRWPIEDLGSQFADSGGAFTDAMAVMASLDLVIGCDSALIHLAGALGVRAWVLLASLSDWRWLREREDSPWYPSMRLFRQQPGEPWGKVVARIAEELKAIVRGDRGRLAPFQAEGGRRAEIAAAILAAEERN